MRVRGGDYDLIIVSLGMRGFDGLRCARSCARCRKARNVPILVVVSDGDRRKLTQALEMGVNDYLTRPVDRNELVARVRTQLRKKRYADRLRHNVQLSRWRWRSPTSSPACTIAATWRAISTL